MHVAELSLGDFVKQLVVLMDQNQLVMLFKDEKPWHLLFYHLKKEQTEGKPNFLSQLRFDWDGSYPKCQELSDYIQALHWTGNVVAVNPSYEHFILDKAVSKIWRSEGESLDDATKGFLAHSIGLAKQQFPASTH
jgi:hypothetical protein